SGVISESALMLAQIFEIAFFLGAAVLIVKSLFNMDQVHFDSILGAVCGYLFLGLGWAVCYSLIETFHPGSFELGGSVAKLADRPRLLPHLLISSTLLPLTTVGYGDVNPFSPPARTFAWMEAIAGQFYLAVIVASLVSLIVANKGGPKATADK